MLPRGVGYDKHQQKPPCPQMLWEPCSHNTQEYMLLTCMVHRYDLLVLLHDQLKAAGLRLMLVPLLMLHVICLMLVLLVVCADCVYMASMCRTPMIACRPQRFCVAANVRSHQFLSMALYCMCAFLHHVRLTHCNVIRFNTYRVARVCLVPAWVTSQNSGTIKGSPSVAPSAVEKQLTLLFKVEPPLPCWAIRRNTRPP